MATLAQFRLINDQVRRRAAQAADDMPEGTVVQFKEPTRSLDQNAKIWAMLSDVSRAKPRDLEHTPDVWKALFMKACDHDIRFVTGLDGHPFPLGFRSSHLTVKQMADLIEFIYAWGSENGVRWSDYE